MKRPTIAVIGGGASATLFLAHLFQQKDLPPASITVYDRSGNFGLGIAYATKNPAHLLNVRAIDISAFHDDPQHFVDWLARNEKNYGPGDFVPRMIYGEYLTGLLDEAKKAAAAMNCQITLRQEEIKNIPGADITIIATGNDRPLSPRGAEKLTSAHGYHADPWSVDYGAVANAKRIVILGTGLSMIDAVLSLAGAGFKGTITAISKKGLVPAVHARPRVGIPPLDAHTLPRSASGLMRFVRERVTEAQAQNIPWQAVINALRPMTNTLWLEMNETERRRFARHLMPYWIIHRHRMAPEAHALISDLMREGRLKIAADWINNVAFSKSLAVEGRNETWQADHVINCLGYAASPAPPPAPTIFAIGPALSATLLETTAIPEIRQAAARTAAETGTLMKAVR